MTSFAFILGMRAPGGRLGFGRVARKVMGTSVIGGMLTRHLHRHLHYPATFYLVEKFAQRKKKNKRGHETPRIGISEGRG